jgi:isopentenyl phosphate kinase
LKTRSIALKLGGSVLTDKSRNNFSNTKAIKRLSQEIFSAKNLPLFIVHGGGSFGHPLAKEYGLANGYKEENQLSGFSKTHDAMISLNKIVVESLINQGLPAFSVSPSSLILTKKGRINFFFDRILKESIKIGLIPVLFGDTVLDTCQGFAVLSGDQLVASLAIRLRAKKIILGTDVDGILTSNPKIDTCARLVRHLSLKSFHEIEKMIVKNQVPDVTGGMYGKISEMIIPVSKGIETIIVNASKPDIIRKALNGEINIGTRIEP